MTNRPKQKGSAWERRLVDFLVTHGHPNAERRVTEGKNDRGDVSGIPGWIVEAKNHRALALAEWCDEAEREAINAGVYRWAVVVPRRAHQTRKAYAVIPLWCLAELMAKPDDRKEATA